MKQNKFNKGDKVKINIPGSKLHNMIATIESTGPFIGKADYAVRFSTPIQSITGTGKFSILGVLKHEIKLDTQ